MAHLQVGQNSWLASKSSKSFCSSGDIIGVGSPQPCLASRTSILPKSWPGGNARNARATSSSTRSLSTQGRARSIRPCACRMLPPAMPASNGYWPVRWILALQFPPDMPPRPMYIKNVGTRSDATPRTCADESEHPPVSPDFTVVALDQAPQAAVAKVPYTRREGTAGRRAA